MKNKKHCAQSKKKPKIIMPTRIILIGILLGSLAFSCNDPNIIGLEIQPPSDRIVITNKEVDFFSINTISEDSLRSDESLYLTLGEINQDPVFPVNKGSFITQILLPSNNIDAITNITVDSVLLQYEYSGFYGDLNTNNDFNVEVYEINDPIHKDSIYFSNNYNEDLPISHTGNNISITQYFSNTDANNPLLKIQLDNSFGEKIMNATGSTDMIDNGSFLNFIKGLYVKASGSNTIMYLDPNSNESMFSVYYHNNSSDSAEVINFIINNDAARINLFNNKDIPGLNTANERTYLQSMSGYKAELLFDSLSYLNGLLENKAINQVLIKFEAVQDINYPSHEKLYLVRENNEGNVVFLTDFTIEGDEHFGGTLENHVYTFNITRYFFQLLNNSEYTNKLFILPAGAAANANRSILDNTKISIHIIYSNI